MEKLGGPGNEADLCTAYEKSPVWLGLLMIVNLLITLANETFINIIFDDSNCTVTSKKLNISVAGVKYKYKRM